MRFLACFDLTHLPLKELLCFMGMVEIPGMWSSDDKEEAPHWNFKKTYLVVTLMQLKQPKMY